MHRLATGAAFLLTLVFALRLDVFLVVEGYAPVPSLLFVALVAALALPRLPRLPAVARSPAWQLLLGCLVLAMIGFVAPGQGPLAWQALGETAVAFVLLTAWLLVYTDEAACRAGTAAFAAALGIAVLLNAYEAFHPVTWSAVAGRSAGTFVNPNLAANGILLAAALLAAATRRPWQLAAVLAVAGAGVLATFSRSGIAIWICLASWFTWGSDRLRPAGRIAAGAVAAALLLATFTFLPDEVSENPNVAQRLAVLRGHGFQDASTGERLALLERGTERFARRPLLGHGPGQSQDLHVGASALGAHNEYLALAIDYGLFGLLLWLAYLLRLAQRGAVPALIVVGLAALSFHALLRNRQTLLFLALFEAAFLLRKPREAAA